MIINLKIELLKIFTLEFSLSSDKEFKWRKGKPDEKDIATASDSNKQPSKS